MSNGKGPFRSPLPSTSATYLLLSLGLPHPVSSSSWQVSCDSGISNIMGSSTKSRLYSHSFIQRPPWASTQGCSWYTPFLNYGWRFLNSFLVFLTPKPESHGRSCQVVLFDGAGTKTLTSVTSASAFCFWYFLSLLKFLFTNWMFGWVSPALRSPLPLFHLVSGFSSNFLSLWALDLAPLHFLRFLFSSNCTFVYFLAQLANFLYRAA